MNANQPVGNYWVRANPNLGTTGFTGGINSAILRYKGAPVAEPTTTQTTSTKPLQEPNLRPLVSMPVVSILLLHHNLLQDLNRDVVSHSLAQPLQEVLM